MTKKVDDGLLSTGGSYTPRWSTCMGDRGPHDVTSFIRGWCWDEEREMLKMMEWGQGL